MAFFKETEIPPFQEVPFCLLFNTILELKLLISLQGKLLGKDTLA